MNTIFVSAYAPTRTSGRAIRTYGVIRALAEHGPVELVYVPFDAETPDPAYTSNERIRLHRVEPSRGASRVLAVLSALAGGAPLTVARGVSSELSAATEAIAATMPDARIVADTPIVATCLRSLAKRRPVIYNSQNLESEGRLGGMSSLRGRGHLVRFERGLLLRSAENWMVSQADLEGAARLAPGARLRLVPNVVDAGAIEPLPPRTGEREVVFVADLSYEPNRDAVRFLLDEVMPELWRRAPDMRLTIAGRGGAGLESHDPRAVLAGFVDDLRDLYARAGAVLVPLREGGGSPLKFVEAMAYGMPVVATPKAAAGLDVVAGTHYVHALPDGPSFAEAIERALDPQTSRAVAEAGRELVEREYSIEALARRLAPS